MVSRAPERELPAGIRVVRISSELIAPELPVEPLPTPPEVEVPVGDPEPELIKPPLDWRPRRAPEPEPPPSVADRLRVRTHDPRLWVRPGRPEVAVRPGEKLPFSEALDRIRALGDSARVALEEQHDALDWTFRTADGSRWGISPDGIHLGDLVIPVPEFAPPPGSGDDFSARLREWHQIQYQAQRQQVRSTFDARVRAIREQRQAQRADTLGIP